MVALIGNFTLINCNNKLDLLCDLWILLQNHSSEIDRLSFFQIILMLFYLYLIISLEDANNFTDYSWICLRPPLLAYNLSTYPMGQQVVYNACLYLGSNSVVKALDGNNCDRRRRLSRSYPLQQKKDITIM